MSTPLWVSELVAAFWAVAGGPEPFPRTLCGPILRSPFDLTVKGLAGLSVGAVEQYLKGLGAALAYGGQDRPLRGCLLACHGAGFIFLDADDPPAERTFSLAHELARFLRDYWRPRQRAAAALGGPVREVFDGRRPPRREERLHALLRGVSLGPHVHLMARDGGTPPPEVAAAERDADRLACELLAPAAEVYARLPEQPGAVGAVMLLCEAFGLPAAAAGAYSLALFPPAPPPDPLTARLEKAWAARRTSVGSRGLSSGGACDERTA